MKEKKSFLNTKIRFVTAVDINKCLTQIKYPRLRAQSPIPGIASNVRLKYHGCKHKYVHSTQCHAYKDCSGRIVDYKSVIDCVSSFVKL